MSNAYRVVRFSAAALTALLTNVNIGAARSHSAYLGNPQEGSQHGCFAEDGGVRQRDCAAVAWWNIPLINDNTGATVAKTVTVYGESSVAGVSYCHWFSNNESGTALTWDLAGDPLPSTFGPVVLGWVPFQPNGLVHIKCDLTRGSRVATVKY